MKFYNLYLTGPPNNQMTRVRSSPDTKANCTVVRRVVNLFEQTNYYTDTGMYMYEYRVTKTLNGSLLKSTGEAEHESRRLITNKLNRIDCQNDTAYIRSRTF